MNPKITLIVCTLSAGMLTLLSTRAPAAEPPPLSQFIYEGVKASDLLDSHVFSRNKGYLGKVRNLALRDDGQIEALIIEHDRVGAEYDAVFRVPWSRVEQPIQPGLLMTNVNEPSQPDLGLFHTDNKNAEHFLISEVLGEYARLEAGQGYGYVKDAVLTHDGKLMAVLVSRDVQAGGGTFAFAYPGRTGRWSPDMSYYGLPYVSADQASRGGLRIDPQKFAKGA